MVATAATKYTAAVRETPETATESRVLGHETRCTAGPSLERRLQGRLWVVPGTLKTPLSAHSFKVNIQHEGL